MRAASFAARVVSGLACLALASSCPATLVAQVPHQAAASETDAAVSATLEALLTALEPRR